MNVWNNELDHNLYKETDLLISRLLTTIVLKMIDVKGIGNVHPFLFLLILSDSKISNLTKYSVRMIWGLL